MLRALRDFLAWALHGEAYASRARLIAAKAERERCLKAEGAALLAGDTRSISAARKASKTATNACLQAEIAFRMANPRRATAGRERAQAPGGSR